MTRRLLIAGVGNVFLGDDAFGCEVLRRLAARQPRPRAGVELRDFGVSVRALGYELVALGGERVVIVDAVAAGAEPGNLQLFDLAAAEAASERSVTHHAQGVADALHIARALGARLEGVYLLGCEPADFELSGQLTPRVEAAAERCVGLLGQLIETPERDLVALCLS